MRMPSRQSSAWDDIDTARTRAKKRRARRYLRVVTEPVEGCDDPPILAYWVNCPRRGRIGIEVCIACPEGGRVRYRGSRGPIAIECKFSSVPSKPKLELVAAPRSGAALAQSAVGELLGAAGFCVTAGLGLDPVAGFLRLRGLPQVPVVDDWLRPVGILSLADIVRLSDERESGQVLTVAQAMRPIFHTLPSSATLLQALSLMWEHRLHALVLIAPSGEVAGVVGEFELLREFESVLDAEG